MATKKRIPEMTILQTLNRALREDAPAAVIRDYCNKLVDNLLHMDATDRLASGMTADFVMALHTMTAKLQSFERENETLKRKLRRDNRRTGKKPEAELLKKTPEPATEQAIQE